MSKYRIAFTGRTIELKEPVTKNIDHIIDRGKSAQERELVLVFREGQFTESQMDTIGNNIIKSSQKDRVIIILKTDDNQYRIFKEYP